MQLNVQTLQGRWNEILGQVRKRWSEIDSNELERFRGNAEQFIGAIQRQTGESREAIEKFIERAASQGATVMENVKQSVQDFTRTAASQTSKAASAVASQSQNLAHQAAEQASAAYRSTQSTVQRRPMESILACFGVGLITGIAVSLLMRSNNSR